MKLNVFIMHHPRLSFFPENTEDLGLLLLRSQNFVAYNLLKRDRGEVQLLARLLVSKWMFVRESFKVCQSYPLFPLFTFIVNQNSNLWGHSKASRQRVCSAFGGHQLLSRVLLSCVYVPALSLQPCFPCYASLHASEPKSLCCSSVTCSGLCEDVSLLP